MNNGALKERIQATLADIPNKNFLSATKDLLNVIGYQSERILPNQSGDVDGFIAHFPAGNPNTASEQFFRDNTKSMHILFQLTSAEISAQSSLLDIDGFDTGNARSFIFAAVELNGKSYSRSQYAACTREINKRFPMPTVVLFKTAADLLTLSFVHRREHKRDPSRDVLGNVSLIREIDITDPHRAHLDILAELSLPQRLHWMDTHNNPRNFDGLLDAWLSKLDTEELNLRFYQDLFDWFERAISEATFPPQEKRTLQPEEHIIRLITRLMFIWFIKEKRLIAEDLFVEHQVSGLLKNYNREIGDSYYRAVLQNLFFATLNTEIDRRGFSKQTNATHRDFSRYRYQKEMTDPDGLIKLFDQTPFINGGLFDCLDSEEATSYGGYRIDCFTDNPAQRRNYSIPNRLFFGASGLITLFENYKFTVEENTPIEQEVALDPELLGKVFENLLAAYNPETRETARKQTGSYYTPRPVVDYMVNEALIASLSKKSQPVDGDVEYWQDRLRYLLDYEDAFDDANELFEEEEAEGIVQAIAEIKMLDPAVGSGAFPMGLLHKLTLALRRLDPDNKRWEALQKERARAKADAAFETRSQQDRDAELLEISETFERYSGDFGRKLYLIQNSIFGVDIQPIACQITKLRFFISLAIEQESDPEAPNYGIKPLPNLETRFVAADTLIGLKGERVLTSKKAQDLERELNENRERHFHATRREKKLACKYRDRELRGKLSEELRHLGFPIDAAEKIAYWDPYDQNVKADWFDQEYMFGIADGFDVVIGNPPYVESRNSLLSNKLKDLYGNQVFDDWGETLPRGSDLLIYFFSRSPQFINDSGYGCFITQNAWLSTDYGKKFQDFSLEKFSFNKITDTSAKFFSDTKSQNINAVITIFSKNRRLRNIEYGIANSDMEIISKRHIEAKQTMKWGHLFSLPQFFADILSKIAANAGTGNTITFGQGLNFPLHKLNELGANVPVIVKDAQFVVVSANEKIRDELVSLRRKNKIPALIMPRGIGSRHYCIFNSCKAFSYSHVELYIPNDLWESEMHYCLWAYLNSSFVWLFREITGRKNLGGGLLKAEATDMKVLPIDFGFDFAEDAKKVFDSLKNREPLSVPEEIITEEHLLIDNMVADYFGFRDMLENIREALVEQINFRLNRARSPK